MVGVIVTVIFTVLAFIGVSIFAALLFRRVVSTNMVHIVQSRRKTTPYGTGQKAGNVYYEWPSQLPVIGVTVIKLPVSNFDLSLKDYEAYDTNRVPFKVDVTAFFRIKDTAIAAQRVATIKELEEQLHLIVQGAVRKVLASDVVEMIMVERAKFGDQFTNEVSTQLAEWGIESVKSMELMDLRDGHNSQVISNIMAKKTSHIEMESRTEVANNNQAAETAEINARQAVDIRRQEAEQAVGQRTAEKTKQIGVAEQQARQEILTQEQETAERDMAVKRVEQVRQAEITKDQEVVAADQDKQTRVIIADGMLEAKRKEAAGIEVEGLAKAAAEKAMQLAPVEAMIVLAKEIGTNPGYQQYLAMIEAIKAHIIVGGKQAEALQGADVKIIANAADPVSGAGDVMGLLGSAGGTKIAAMVEAFAQTPLGKATLARMGIEEGASKSDVVDETPPAATTTVE